MTSLPQQMKEKLVDSIREDIRNLQNYNFDVGETLEKAADELWNAAQEEMLERAIALIPPAFNPANALMDDNRIGQNSMRKKILAALSSLREGETPYYKTDHEHCWEQERGMPACGLTKHTQCCLCEEPIAGESTKP